jgi:hypothetical protein
LPAPQWHGFRSALRCNPHACTTRRAAKQQLREHCPLPYPTGNGTTDHNQARSPTGPSTMKRAPDARTRRQSPTCAPPPWWPSEMHAKLTSLPPLQLCKEPHPPPRNCRLHADQTPPNTNNAAPAARQSSAARRRCQQPTRRQPDPPDASW